MTTPIIQIKNVFKSFRQSEAQELLVLSDINFTLHEGEIVALLGKSGSGKSTLLRIIAGLLEATSGEILYRGTPVLRPVKGIAMVFQTFALMPWLTVLQNVELGLEALGVARTVRRQKALAAIDMVGLDGFESAFPKELSGGMRQRVGFARALVVDPDVLLMDEPFSALDILTAENLRGDLLDLWYNRKTKIKGILFVTHSIDEAVYLADRIIILGMDPNTIHAELPVRLHHPRYDNTPSYRKLIDKVYSLMTTEHPEAALASPKVKHKKRITMGYRLPDVDILVLTGLLETIVEEHNGRIHLPELAEKQHLDVNDLFPMTDVLEVLQLASVSDGDIELTDTGKHFALSDILERKQLFAKLLLEHVPLAKHIRSVLDRRPDHRAHEDRFIVELEDYLSTKDAKKVLKVVIDWGRYAEVFAYDFNDGFLSLENPEA